MFNKADHGEGKTPQQTRMRKMTTDNGIEKAEAEEEARISRDTPYPSHWEWLRLLKGQGHTMAVAIIEAKQELNEIVDDGEWQRAEALIKLLAWLDNWPLTTLVDDVLKECPAWADAKRAEKRIDDEDDEDDDGDNLDFIHKANAAYVRRSKAEAVLEAACEAALESETDEEASAILQKGLDEWRLAQVITELDDIEGRLFAVLPILPYERDDKVKRVVAEAVSKVERTLREAKQSITVPLTYEQAVERYYETLTDIDSYREGNPNPAKEPSQEVSFFDGEEWHWDLHRQDGRLLAMVLEDGRVYLT